MSTYFSIGIHNLHQYFLLIDDIRLPIGIFYKTERKTHTSLTDKSLDLPRNGSYSQMNRLVRYLTTNADLPTFCLPRRTTLTSSFGRLVDDWWLLIKLCVDRYLLISVLLAKKRRTSDETNSICQLEISLSLIMIDRGDSFPLHLSYQWSNADGEHVSFLLLSRRRRRQVRTAREKKIANKRDT